MRRCGVGIAKLYPHVDDSNCFSLQSVLAFGAYGPLPGAVQNVPRAELYAILLVAQNAWSSSVYVVHSDSATNVQLYQNGEAACLASENSDLWEELWKNVHLKALNFQLLWVKAHCDTAETAAAAR